MNKKDYLNALHNYLTEKKVVKQQVKSIVEDYEELYDESLARGLDEEAIVKKLGSVSEVYNELEDTLKFDKKAENRIVALSPFIAIIAFFALIFGIPESARFAWLVFLLIPVTAIIVNVRGKDKYIALSPFLATIIYMISGFLWNLWHPMWLIFLIIPLLAVTLSGSIKKRLVSASPFVIIIAYILLGTYVSSEFYLYGYAIFALIPILAIVTNPLSWQRLTLLGAIIIAVITQQLLYHVGGIVRLAWLPYLLPLLLAIVFNEIHYILGPNFNIKDKKGRTIFVVAALIIILYLVISVIVKDIWHWSWIILMLIPIITIYIEHKFKAPVAYMPFIAVIVFMLLGVFGHLWHIAWIVFLAIPIVAIITGEKKGEEEKDLDE